ncbi:MULTISPECIES: hypothetical protein [Streptomyces]|uniref:Peptidase C1A papain C-terminal domain-containing protein n=1 Tax=Streptomyces lycii TaxID=2654337 RepID=A0ABQ7FH88_9ACTN|nr:MULTISPECIES: hypothetical protein [Streptomyces]KAF4406597.1 hypothetical protein GCU69_24115 [Streptomyces lycii]PGH50674.1 hypothetical protein CRI70_10820 [Streptomyces sp. Ru87]
METLRLKNGNTTIDPRLDRVPQFDERSREYPIRALVTERAPLRSAGWACPVWLDQGREGACVGFSWSHELIATPVPVDEADNAFARDVYREARQVDDWPGEEYEGTSVLAGAKAVVNRGYMEEYRWAFGIDDVLRTLGYFGPVVIGVKWYDSMFRPAPNGLLEVSPGDFGGHAILVRGVSLKARLAGHSGTVPVVRLRNSWGRKWGVDGDCYMRVEDLDALLRDGGEACVPVVRKTGPLNSPRTDPGLLRESGEIS